MAMYDNRRAGVPIASIEFSPMPDGNFTFFYLRDGGQAAAVKQLITSPSFGQHVVTETKLNGKPVLVTQGAKSQTDILSLLASDGNDFSPRLPVRKWNLWRVRGTMGTVGQLGQLASALLPVPVFDPIAHKVRREVDYGTLIFAASNLTANGINIAFGAEKTPDVNQLHFLKENLNERIAPHVAPGGNLPATDDDTRYHLREEPEKPHSIGKKFHDFMQRNSVAFGEIGLRYFGSFALAFPITNEHKHFSFKGWKGGVTELSKGNFRGAWDSARNKHSVYSLAGGLTYMTGKTIALMSKIPDPYENKKHTWWDSVREHVTFHASSVIETFAGATIAYDRLNLRHNAAGAIVNKLRLPEWHILGGLGGREFQRDWFGGIGGLLFASAYITRFFAPFGEKQLDFNELKAHVSDSLANVKPEEIPKLLADCAATIKEHAKDKPIEMGQIYTAMLSDLYQYHHVTTQGVTAVEGHENRPFAPMEKSKHHESKPSTKLAVGARELASRVEPEPTAAVRS